MIMGDLNEIQSPNEKCGGSHPPIARFQRLHNIKTALGLLDVPTTGGQFTWRKRKDGPDNIYSKIDRLLAHDIILQWYPSITLKNHAFTSSDHCQISVDLRHEHSYSNRPFKFEMLWTQRKDFELVVKQAWRAHVSGTLMFDLTHKTKVLKNLAKKWNKLTFGNIFRQLDETDKDLLRVQGNVILQSDMAACRTQRRLLNKRELLLDFQRRYWGQRAKIKHLKLSDSNSGYFHKIASGRRNKKIITSLTLPCGLCISDEMLIKQELLREFTTRFRTTISNHAPHRNMLAVITKEVTREDNLHLTKGVTNSEVKAALFQIALAKAPGPDGIPAGFYQNNWHIIGPSVTKAVKSFF